VLHNDANFGIGTLGEPGNLNAQSVPQFAPSRVDSGWVLALIVGRGRAVIDLASGDVDYQCLSSWFGSRGHLRGMLGCISRRYEMEDERPHNACPNGNDCAYTPVRNNANGDHSQADQ
jgi:hypothetical protein